MLGVYFMENPISKWMLTGVPLLRKAPYLRSSHLPFFTCTPVLSQSYLVIIWLLSGYYMVIIWFLYGYYMVYDNNNLVGGAMCPSWKMELKSMGRMTSHIIIMEHKSHVWNHQPVLYEGGRVIYFPCWSNPIISDLQDLPTPLVAKWDDPPSNQLS